MLFAVIKLDSITLLLVNLSNAASGESILTNLKNAFSFPCNIYIYLSIYNVKIDSQIRIDNRNILIVNICFDLAKK